MGQNAGIVFERDICPFSPAIALVAILVVVAKAEKFISLLNHMFGE